MDKFVHYDKQKLFHLKLLIPHGKNLTGDQ